MTDKKLALWELDRWNKTKDILKSSWLPNSILLSTDVLNYTQLLLKQWHYSQEEINIFWDMFFITRDKVYIVLENKLAITENDSFKARFWLDDNTPYICEQLTHPHWWCWSEKHPCPMKEIAWTERNISIVNHIHPKKWWKLWMDQVIAMKLPKEFFEKMPEIFHHRLRLTLDEDWSSPVLDEDRLSLVLDQIWTKEIFIHKTQSISKKLRRLIEWSLGLEFKEDSDDRFVWDVLMKFVKDLAKAYDILWIHSKEKWEFLSTVSHEIRTPLNWIIGLIYIILDDDTLDEKHKDSIKKVQELSLHLLDLLNNVLDFSKIESWKLEIANIPFSLSEFIDTTISSLSLSAEEKWLSLEVDLCNWLPEYIIWDPTRLRQILINLIWNSIKFTEKWKIVLTCKNWEEWIYFEVQDDWIWMNESDLELIFQDFIQVDWSTTRKYWGTWLGLAITRKIIKFMWWEIKVESELNKWSKFYFTLPLEVWEKPRKVLRNLNESWECLIWKRVLLVEDNPVNQVVAQYILLKFGCTVDIVENGVEAINWFNTGEYDFIIMDMEMPLMGGVEATKEIRRLEKERWLGSIPIIASTANVFQKSINQCTAAWMNGFVKKPIDADKLKEILIQYLSSNTDNWFVQPSWSWFCFNLDLLKEKSKDYKNSWEFIDLISENLVIVYDHLNWIAWDLNVWRLLEILLFIEGESDLIWMTNITHIINKLKNIKEDLIVSDEIVKETVREIKDIINNLSSIKQFGILEDDWGGQYLDILKFDPSWLRADEFLLKIAELWEAAPEIISNYLSSLVASVENINKALAQQNLDNLAATASALKGTSDMVWAFTIKCACTWFEIAWRMWNMGIFGSNDTNLALKMLEQGVNNTLEVLGRYLNEESVDMQEKKAYKVVHIEQPEWTWRSKDFNSSLLSNSLSSFGNLEIIKLIISEELKLDEIPDLIVISSQVIINNKDNFKKFIELYPNVHVAVFWSGLDKDKITGLDIKNLSFESRLLEFKELINRVLTV